MSSRSPPDWTSSSHIPAEEWAHRPTKRKRLLKACSQCHRSKRRCDGFGPCQNCEFAGKQCVYLDASGREISPPHGRHSFAERLPSHQPSSHPVEPSRRGLSGSIAASIVLNPPEPIGGTPPTDWNDSTLAPPRPPIDRSASQVTREDLGVDAVLCRDLINIFFSKVFPFNNIFHRPSFLHDLANGLVPRYLLHSMFALAAPLSNSPVIRRPPGLSAYDEPPPPWKLGDRFALAAINALHSISTAKDGEIRAEDHPGHELELAQTLFCLSLNESTVRRPNGSFYHQEILQGSLRILLDWGKKEEESGGDYLRGLTGQDKQKRIRWKQRETHRRILWVTQFTNMLATALCVLPMCFRDLDVRLPLPMNDGAFDLMEHEDSIPEYLALPVRNPSGNAQRMYISEFGHLIRVTAVYARVIGFVACLRKARQKAFNAGEDYCSCSFRDTFQTCRDHLETWRCSLPNELLFNDANTNVQLSNFDAGISHAGFSYAYMHAIAQCTLLSLYEALEVNLDYDVMEEFAPLRQKAHDSLLHILDCLGPRGRSSIFMASLLVHVGGHGLPLDELSVMHAINDHRARLLLEEYRANWGVPPQDLLNTAFRTRWVKPVLTINAFTLPEEAKRSPQQGSPGANSPSVHSTDGLMQRGCFSSWDENKHIACQTPFTKRKVRHVPQVNRQGVTTPQFFVPPFVPGPPSSTNTHPLPRGFHGLARDGHSFTDLTLPPIRNPSVLSTGSTSAPPPAQLEPYRQLHPLPFSGAPPQTSPPLPFDTSARDALSRPRNNTLPSPIRPTGGASQSFSGFASTAQYGSNPSHGHDHRNQRRTPPSAPPAPWITGTSSSCSTGSVSSLGGTQSCFDDRPFQGRK